MAQLSCTKGLGIIMIALLPAAALAASPTSNVGGSKVDAGALSAEFRSGYLEDNDSRSTDGRVRLREQFDYGVNDWYAFRFIVQQDKPGGENLEHRSFGFENRIQLIEKRDSGWDGGIRLGYTQSDGDKAPNEITLRMLAQVPFAEKYEWRHDTAFSHEVGEDSTSGLGIEVRNQVTIKVDSDWEEVDNLKLGIEMFNDFGNLRELYGYTEQDHQIGPVLKADFAGGYYVQLGYRIGISENAPDHLFKLFLGRNF